MKSAHGQMAFDRADRYKEDGQFKCRKGKECNGRCIPKSSECNVDTQGSKGFERRTATAKNIENGIKGAAAGIGLAGAAFGVTKGIQNLQARHLEKNAKAKAEGATAAPENGREVALPSAPNRPMLSSKSTAAGGGAIVKSEPAPVAIRVKPSQKLSTQMIETGKATVAAVKQGYQEGPGNPEAFKKAGKAAGRAAGKVVIKVRKKINEMTGK